MKRVLLFIFLMAISNKVKAQPETIWQLLNDGSIIRWAYTGGDEFNGTQLDYSKWDDTYPWGRSLIGNQEQEYYKPGTDNISFDNGIIRLITKHEPGYYTVEPWHSGNDVLSDGQTNNRYFPYTSGMIFSKQKFKYGLFEIRFKLPIGKGLWPAFWLFGGNPNEEFDIFEYKGETPNRIHVDMHCPGNDCNNFGGWATATGNFSDGFNDMIGEWGPNFSVWYLNGDDFVLWLGNLNYQANVIANMAVAKDCPAVFCPGPDGTTPVISYFEIDYIRVWTRLDCQQVITICNYNQASTDPTVITGNQISVGGLSCNSTVQNGQNLNLIATNCIELLNGFTAELESDFAAKIIDCSGTQMKCSFDSTGTDSLLHILSGIEPDSINNSRKGNEVEITFNQTTALYVKIYPNPTDGKISIEFIGQADKEFKIELINSVGQSVFKGGYNRNKKIDIDISHLSKGTYFLKGTVDSKTISDKIILK